MKQIPVAFYPIFLDLAGKKCVVIGGGQVAWRKVAGLLDIAARVDVISPVFCPEIKELADAGKVNLRQRAYQPGDLQGAAVAIAATDDSETNSRVSNEARENSILVNVVDDPWISDFILPSCVQRGDLTIAVSTRGKSPALARKIRQRLEEMFTREYAEMTSLIGEVRSEFKDRGIKIASARWQESLDLDALIDLLKVGKREQAKDLLRENLKKT